MTFRCISLCSSSLSHPGIAIATAAAGGIGLIDLEFSDGRRDAHEKVWALASASQGDVGLRICGVNAAWASEIRQSLGDRRHWLIVPARDASAWHARSTVGRCHLLVEVVDIDDLGAFASVPVDGIVAKGNEAGGWIGEDTTFVLAQKVLVQAAVPVYLQGGIGIHNVAACRAAGAAGVVLDDQVLLMPESGLARRSRAQIEVAAVDTRVFGEHLGRACRVLTGPGLGGASRIQTLADKCETENALAADWFDRANECIGWDDTSSAAFPIGQAFAFAAGFRDRYPSIGRLIQAMQSGSADCVAVAASVRPLAPGGPLAVAHRTRYPIAQGPMTRVSDSPEFALSVAEAGGLPFLALALMNGDQTRSLLETTARLLGDRAWGVGVLGFVPQELRERQLQEIIAVKPPFALIAGGRPDQALALERQGICTYIHVPSPNLLRMFLDQGATHFVFEGRECGGHIGPLTSFVLWDVMVGVLLEMVARGGESSIHVLFAGGIHDERSAAMVSAIAAPLAQRGMRVGVLMGSAYLFTDEIVSTGAMMVGFQRQAIACRRTVNLETGPGHSTRCAVTPFAHEFHEERRRLVRERCAADEVRDRLESLNLGRLRIASKGKARRGEGSPLVDVDEAAQIEAGMYMIGQVATMRSATTSIAELHRSVSEVSTTLISDAARPSPRLDAVRSPSDVAIIGIGTLLPKATSPEAYWRNILGKIGAITEIPQSRFDWRLYFDEDRHKRDKIYSRWGGFLDEVVFDPLRFGIPPNSIKSIDPVQLLALEVVRLALENAGYANGDFDKENTSVIIGAGGGLGDLGLQYGVRSEIARFVDSPSDDLWDRLPEWTEESFAGSLLNVIAGRVANRFNLGGLNFTVDAACASSLAAIDIAVAELESGRSNLAIAGGVDTVQSPFGYLCFSKTQALSPRGRARTFDAQGDGIVISEGLAVVVLKRLADAVRDGDRIYSVIKAVAGSSDGRALGLTAPLPDGQMRALRRAYAKAHLSPRTVGLLEAHGTGTVVGDRAEAETVVKTLEQDHALPKSCAIGSVKTLIGHTKATAGMAGLVKVAMALYHKTLPAHEGVDTPIATIANEKSPVYLLKDARPWLHHPDHPRRGAVSSFGFGGTNFHAVLEEYEDASRPGGVALCQPDWPCELLIMRAKDRAEVVQQARMLGESLPDRDALRLRDLAYSLMLRASRHAVGGACLGVVAQSIEDFGRTLKVIVDRLAKGETGALATNAHFSDASPGPDKPVALLFPGQGAQYPNMAREPMLYLPDLRAAMEQADRHVHAHFDRLLSDYVYPPSAFGEEEERRNLAQLTDTRVAQIAIGTIEAGFLDFATRIGIKPQMVAGHSYGEYAALHAAGSLNRSEFLSLSALRGNVMAEACASGDPGTMAAIPLARTDLESRLAKVKGVIIANHNAPRQSVISGPRERIQDVLRELATTGVNGIELPVAGAFHSELVATAQRRLAEAIHATSFRVPVVPAYSNTTGDPYPSDPDAIRAQLASHLIRPVEFVEQIERMYAAGARIFVELGPRSILTGFVDQILEGREHWAIPFDTPAGGLRGLLIALARLVTSGVTLDLSTLFDGRDARELDIDHLAAVAHAAAPPPTAWFVTGGGARAPNEASVRTGTRPTLTLETAQSSRGPRVPQSEAQLPPRSMPGAGQARAADVARAASSAEAFLSYQETMRQFLALQEHVMERFLGAPRAMPPASISAVDARSANTTSDSASTETHGAIGASATVSRSEPAAESIDAEALTRTLLEIVSDRTGYGVEALGKDLDLEAELGVDSIKRVEILGALQRKLPLPLAERSRERMDRLTRVKTISGIISELVAADAVEATSQLAAAPRASEGAFGEQELVRLLTTLVSERTGYPPEMLGKEQALEADLGVDSIKRVEILGALQKRLPEALAARMRDRIERLTRLKTLDAIAREIMHCDLPQSRDEPAHTETLAARRFVMRGESEPLLRNAGTGKLVGRFVVTDDSGSVAEGVERAIRDLGGEVERISAETLVDADALQARIESLRNVDPPVRGVVHLAPLSSHGIPEKLDDWQRACVRDAKALFQLLKGLAPALMQAAARGEGVVLSASTMGGRFARGSQSHAGSASSGAAVGLLKTLAFEWPGIRARALDFDDTQSATGIAERVIGEMLADHYTVEVGYPTGVRTIFRTVAEELQRDSTAGVVRAQDWTVLITGGARGITTAIARELALPGMTYVVVGQSPEPEAESPDTASISELPALRRVMRNELLRHGDNATPVVVERKVTELLRRREIRTNLAHLRNLGVAVDYCGVDVRDGRRFGELIDDLYRRHGKIDVVLHGAGVIDDSLIVNKSAASFARVFDTKADSAFILSRHLRPESLKLLLLFSSVAGRYGNPGQCDYAAANEVMNRLAGSLDRRWPGTRVISINWGPWDSPGMASEDVKRHFRDQGIVPIPVAAGCAFVRDELQFGRKGDVEVIAGDGPWSSASDAHATDRDEGLRARRLQLSPRMLSTMANGTVTLLHEFNATADPYLLDHRLNGKLVLPAACVAEWMARFVQAAWPDWVVAEISELSVLKGLVVDEHSSKAALFRAKPSTHSDGETLRVTVHLSDPAEAIVYYRGSVALQRSLPLPTKREMRPPVSGKRVEVADAYREFLFHGERFQLLREVTVHADGVDAVAIASDPAGFKLAGDGSDGWLFDPGLLDVAFQLAIIWSRSNDAGTPLPSRIGEIRRYGTSRPVASLRVLLRVDPSRCDPHLFVYDCSFLEDEGFVRLALADVEATRSTALDRLAANT